MQIEGNKATANQLPVSTVGSEATGSGGSSATPGQPEGVQQQSGLSEGSTVSLLKQDGVLVIFSIDKKTNEFVVKTIDPSSNEVVKEIPPQEIPALASSIQQAGGILVDKQA